MSCYRERNFTSNLLTFSSWTVEHNSFQFNVLFNQSDDEGEKKEEGKDGEKKEDDKKDEGDKKPEEKKPEEEKKTEEKKEEVKKDAKVLL